MCLLLVLLVDLCVHELVLLRVVELPAVLLEEGDLLGAEGVARDQARQFLEHRIRHLNTTGWYPLVSSLVRTQPCSNKRMLR